MLERIVAWVRSLVPRLERDTIKRELESTRNEIEEYTLPSYESLKDIYRGREWKSEDVQKFERRFQKEVSSRHRGNFVEVTHGILKDLNRHLSMLDRLASRRFNEEITPKALPFSKAQLLRLIEMADFLSRYSRGILVYTILKETSSLRQQDLSYDMTPGHVKWLTEHQGLFFTALRIFSDSPEDIEATIDDLPDLEVDESGVKNIEAQVGSKRLDPFHMAHHAKTPLNPIYYVRIAIAEWRHHRYEAAKETRRMLEYQIRDLRNALEGTNDPKLEQALEYQIDRLEKLNAKITKYEREVHEK